MYTQINHNCFKKKKKKTGGGQIKIQEDIYSMALILTGYCLLNKLTSIHHYNYIRECIFLGIQTTR